MPVFTKSNTIQEHSTHYFSTPSDGIRESLFYRDMFGHFVCDSRYRVERTIFDSYLLIYTLEGEGTVITPDGKSICQKHDIALIDCNQAHTYYANEFWDFLWFHFNGNASRKLVNFILSRQGTITHVTDSWQMVESFQYLTKAQTENSVALEITLSAHIHHILAELAAYELYGKTLSSKPDIANRAAQYISQHCSEPLSIQQIANEVAVSKSALCHIFKSETGFSPYDYMIGRRIDMAKDLLWSTDMSIREISQRVGFLSESHFIKTFRMRTKMSPTTFRQSPVI